ncbi:MAG: TlpA family protein disulfide reductase [Cyclobacteriaceae bacterium]
MRSTLLIFLFALACTSPSSDIDRVELSTLDGTAIDWDQYEGKIVFVNFWATWCKPCLQEMPTIAKAMTLPESSNVVFLFASNESIELIERFNAKQNFDFDFVQVHNMESLNVQALPTTFIFDPSGNQIFSEAGYRDWSTPESLALFNSKNP